MIYVECKPDYTLLKSFKIRSRNIIHAGCKSMVCKNLEKSNNSKGLIDQDPLSVQPPYLESLEKIDNQLDIQILYDSARKNG